MPSYHSYQCQRLRGSPLQLEKSHLVVSVDVVDVFAASVRQHWLERDDDHDLPCLGDNC